MVKTFEVSGKLLIGIILIIVIVNYSKLPDTIPIHYGLSGEPDNFGSKIFIFTLPALYIFLYFGIGSFLEKQKNNILLVNYVRFMIGVLFLLIILNTINIAYGGSGFETDWLFPALVLLTLIPVIISIFKNKQNKKGG